MNRLVTVQRQYNIIDATRHPRRINASKISGELYLQPPDCDMMEGRYGVKLQSDAEMLADVTKIPKVNKSSCGYRRHWINV